MIEGERKLATIRRIADINPIPGADAIVKLSIDGWDLVSAKDSGFKTGDLCVYFEIDSFLPVIPAVEFLRSRCFKSTAHLGDGFRLRTIKLRGQISQGLAMPLHEFFEIVDGKAYWSVPNGSGNDVDSVPLVEGDDITAFLGVKKWEAAPEKEGRFGPQKAKGNFPSFLRKTDQERIQNCFAGIKRWATVEMKNEFVTELPAITGAGVEFFPSGDGFIQKSLVPLNDNEIALRDQFEATLKVDGSSLTLYHNDGHVGVCSRNLELKRDPENLFWKTAIKSRLLPALVHCGRNMAIQGEMMGPGVQGNREGFEDHKFFIFDVFDIDAQAYLAPIERMQFLMGLASQGVLDTAEHNRVPYLGMVSLASFESVKAFLQFSKRPSINHKTAEGIVYRSLKAGGPTFKAINDDFLLAEVG